MSTSDAFDRHIALVERSRATVLPAVTAAAAALAAAFTGGNRCIAFGNGGSAADAQHFVAELVGHFDGPRPPLPAVALGGDAATTTSIANDLGFEELFARQVTALCAAGDVVVAISTSGRSPNVVAGARAGHQRGCTVIGITADGGHDLAAWCDVLVDVPSTDTQRIQEVHSLCLHSIVAELEALLGPDHAA